MVTEAYDKKAQKFKVGMQAHVFGKEGAWYIAALKTNDIGELIEITLFNSDMAFTKSNPVSVYPTGKFEPDILKLVKKLQRSI